ncbi:hypothetical protein F4680DRAFT_401207 [Xylaria scruposa]|nr:hypothetical protein F4680DRAFT_401207 [Xylaria scruposa]
MPLTDDQFIQLLEGFADLDVFNGLSTPVIFVVYAHNNEVGESKADVVHLLIKWLKTIRARAISDKLPLLSSIEYTDSVPAGNILDNQFRLIPARGSDHVQKVILCGSEVLQHYWADPFTENYVRSIRGLYQEDGLRQFQDNVRERVQKDSGKPGFHHILTELAFLQIRKDADRTHHGIIPVVLTGDDVRHYLPFIEASDVFLKNQEHDPRKMFFKLLERIFIHMGDRTVIDAISNCYANLQNKNETSDSDVKVQVHNSIQKMNQNHSAAWRARRRCLDNTTTRHFMVPFGRNENFVGREDILEQLLERIPPAANRDNCQRTAIGGLGGVGKTQIAIEVAYRVRDQHADCSIYWVPAIDMVNFENAFREIGQKLGIEGIDHDKADVKLLVKHSLSQSVGSWLLIIDNADDEDMLFTGAKLTDHLPFSRNGSILFTTRYDNVAVRLQALRKDIITVHEMSNDEATILLYNNLQESQKGDNESITRLLKLLVNFPLAIKQASAYLASNMDVTVFDYLDQCESSDTDMFDMLTKDFEDSGRYLDAKVRNSIAATWLISFQHITEHNPQAADYLKFISFLAEKDIPRSLLPESKPIKMKEALSTLKAYAFIAERNDPDAFDMHRLVRLVMRNWLQKNGEWKEWAAKVVQRLNEEYPSPTYKNMQTWTKYLPHGQAVLSDGAIDISDIRLLVHTAESYIFLGKYSAAEKLYRHTLDLREEVPRKHPNTLTTMNNLGLVLRDQGRYEKAEELLQQTLDLSEEVLGRKHPDTLSTMDNLGFVFYDQGEYKKAEEICRQILDLSKEVLGRKHPDTITTMNNLALIFCKQKRYKEAKEILQQALDLKEEVLGKKHPDTLKTINNLGYILHDQGEYKKAEEIHRQTLDLREEVLGRKHPDTLGTMDNLGFVLYDQGEYKKAEEICRQTLDLREEVLGRDHPDTLNTAKLLANILRKQAESRSSTGGL